MSNAEDYTLNYFKKMQQQLELCKKTICYLRLFNNKDEKISKKRKLIYATFKDNWFNRALWKYLLKVIRHRKKANR